MKRNSKWIPGEGGVRGTWKSVTTDGGGEGGLSDGDYGDITVGGSGTTMAIDNGAVTLAKMAALADLRLLGNVSGGSAAPSALTAQQAGNLIVQSGVWTPVLTFSTPGDLAVTYGTQEGLYLRIGNLVIATFRLFTSAFSHSTASGTLGITGLPVAAANVTQPFGILGDFQGITKANYSQFVARAIQNTSLIRITASGSGQTVVQIVPGDMPTAGSVRLAGTVLYTV